MMKFSRNQTLTLTSFTSLILAFIFWMTLAPTQLGGRVTYVIVDGISMEPGFSFGDLVLVQSKPAYGMGDAVVYRDPNMGSYIFHRIIGNELDRFVLQGDNNSWLDSYHPTHEEVVGKLWFHIPKLGKAIEWMRVPIHLSLITGLMGGVLMLNLFNKQSKNKRKRDLPSLPLGEIPQGVMYGFGFFALLFLALGIFAFTRPLYGPAENILYQQEGYYYYSATGTPGVYDTDVVRSGEPVFPKLTCFLNIGFTYNIVGNQLQGVSGSHKMYARIMDEQSGWLRTIPLNANTTFTGNSHFTMAALDLCQVESIVNLVEAEAGLKQIVYTLEIVSDAGFTASVNGEQISDAFSPSLVFKYDKVHFYLAAVSPQTDPLRASKQGMVGGSSPEPGTISFLGMVFTVWTVRMIALSGFVFSLLGIVAAGMMIYRAASQSQDALIRLKYGAMLVNVNEQNLAPTSSVIDVTTMDDLAKLAERQGTMILHMVQNFLHSYLVQSNGITYRYVINSGKKGILPARPTNNEVPKPAETVNKKSAPEPAPIRREVSSHMAGGQKNQTAAALPIQSARSKHVSIQTEEIKPTKESPVREESMEYVLDIDAINKARPAPVTPFDYVIDTGAIEVVTPSRI